MKDTSLPIQSTQTLLKASAVAIFIAGIVLVTIILPAEYNIDPTGIGKTIGLTKLAPATANNPVEASTSTVVTTEPVIVPSKTNPVAAESGRSQQRAYRRDSVVIKIAAGQGLEYKFHLLKHSKMAYHWKAEGGKLHFDFHGEPKGDKSGYFESFALSTAGEMEGSLTTPFEGSHGWYWRNDSQHPITITLNTQGSYDIIGLIN